MTGLPDGWDTRALGDIADIVRGVTYKKSDAKSVPGLGYSPLLRATNIGSSLNLGGELVYVPTTGVTAQQFLRRGDIVLASSSGSLSVVGKNARLLADWDGTFGAFCAVIRSQAEVDSSYLALYLSSDPVRRRWSEAARGTNINNLKKSDLVPTPVPCPPLDEQLRIVDILEDHLSRLDAAEHGLNLALRRLASYEAAALSRCRDGHERPLSDLTEIQGGIQKQPKRAPKQNAHPFLRVANVTKSGLQLDDVHLVELFDGELDRLRLRLGDLLVVEGNGSASQIGRAALWDGSIEDCVHQNHLIRVRPVPALSASYLEAVWNSPQNRRQLTDLASSSSGLHTLSVSKLKSLKLPLPTLERQQELVAKLQGVRDRRGRLALELDSAVSRTKQLRRSLLAAAFQGRLTGHSIDMEMVEEMAGV